MPEVIQVVSTADAVFATGGKFTGAATTVDVSTGGDTVTDGGCGADCCCD